ncbi:MAG: hypothetical protein UDG86_05730 [Lachnospiraceae bacterium]|jgi:hypothetical protein|nr:hypothetical protein [Lachnospiraceae bacterium]
MNRLEDLKIKIEEERGKLDKLVEEMKLEESYRQSVLLDGLIEEYICLTT